VNMLDFVVCYMLSIHLMSVAVQLGVGQPLVLLIVVLVSFMPNTFKTLHGSLT